MTSAPSPGGPSWKQNPATPHPADRPASSSFFRWLRGLDITRAPDRWVGGVAGGVARRTGLDLALVRGLIVILSVFGGIGVLLYGLAWALLPEPDGRIHVEQAGRGSWTSGLSGAAALVAIGLWRPNLPFLGDGGGGGLLWTLFWIGAVVLFVYWIVNRSGGGRARPDLPGGGPAAPGNGPTHPSGPAPFGPAPFGPAPFGPSSTGPAPGGTGPSQRPAPGGTGPSQRPSDGPSDSSGDGPADRAAGGSVGAHDSPTGRQGDDGPGAGRMHGDAPFGEDVHHTVPLPYQPDARVGSTLSYPLPYQPGQVAWSSSPTAYLGSRPVEPDLLRGAARTVPQRCSTRPSGSATALLIGGAITVAAVLLALDYVGVLGLVNSAVVALAAAAIVLALGIVALGTRGRSSGLVGLVAALATIGALASSFTVVGGAWVVAQENRTTPASLQAASDGFSILAAETTIDLTGLPAPTRDVVVPVNSLVSDVTVIVPEDVPVEVRTRMALGSADARGTAEDIGTPSPEFRSDGGVLRLSDGELNPDATGAALILDVRGAMSDVTIRTASDTVGSDPRTDTTPTGETP
ncbi:PspC domain-containing protein [Arthrobacter sp. MDT1-48-3]